MLRVCIASIQNVKRSLLLLVVSASDIPLRTIKFFSVLFSSAYWSMHQAVTNKHSMVRRRLCHISSVGVGILIHLLIFFLSTCHFLGNLPTTGSQANCPRCYDSSWAICLSFRLWANCLMRVRANCPASLTAVKLPGQFALLPVVGKLPEIR